MTRLGNLTPPDGVVSRVRRPIVLVMAIVSVVAGTACAPDERPGRTGDAATDSPAEPETTTSRFPPPPAAPTGPLGDDIAAALDDLFGSLTGVPDTAAIEFLGASGDPRVAWLLADVMRFVSPGSELLGRLVEAWSAVTGVTIEPDRSVWGTATDHLIAWDLPAPPGYVDWKRIVFEFVESGWRPFFDDAGADIDWRLVSWGGVRIDDRPLDQTDGFCIDGCIPALNDPALVRADTDDDWLPDDVAVFGVLVNGESVAFPKNIMQIHEMVNMTIGGRRLGIPYCTLCGSAQAYFTDIPSTLPDDASLAVLDDQQGFELRTSGLLIRSNKVMYEFHTRSVFDTFTGRAVSGPLGAAGVVLEQTSVLATTWGAWKSVHPDSWLIAEDGGIGRSYPPDPLRGRDDDGPIFPIGDVDPRLGVQDAVVGVVDPDGVPVAFARTSLDEADGPTTFGGITVRPTAGGYRAEAGDGRELATHEAFWFAWSQFHPETRLWGD